MRCEPCLQLEDSDAVFVDCRNVFKIRFKVRIGHRETQGNGVAAASSHKLGRAESRDFPGSVQKGHFKRGFRFAAADKRFVRGRQHLGNSERVGADHMRPQMNVQSRSIRLDSAGEDRPRRRFAPARVSRLRRHFGQYAAYSGHASAALRVDGLCRNSNDVNAKPRN